MPRSSKASIGLYNKRSCNFVTATGSVRPALRCTIRSILDPGRLQWDFSCKAELLIAVHDANSDRGFLLTLPRPESLTLVVAATQRFDFRWPFSQRYVCSRDS